MNKTTLAYNRHTRKWELKGEIGELLADFPAGNEGHRDAILAQIKTELPAAHAEVIELEQAFPQLAGRAIRAAQLVIADRHVIKADDRWRVRADDGRHIYTVFRLRDATWAWHCNCQDWMNGEAGASNGAPWIKHAGVSSPICKHIIAVMLTIKLRSMPSQWPPSCPECNRPMQVKHQRNNGSGLPFWSCSGFPNCKGRASFQPHPDDLDAANGDGRQALFLSFERAQAENLVAVAIGAQHRARRREIEAERDRQRARAYNEMVNAGHDPKTAAEIIDAGFMSFEDWREHYQHYGDNRSSDYHEQQVRY